MLHTLSEILFANLDVSTGVFSWLLYFLAGNSGVQDELRREIMQQREDLEDYYRRKDSLLSYCIMESFRLRPFTGTIQPRQPKAGKTDRVRIAFSIPESSPVDKVFGGFLVPANVSSRGPVEPVHLARLLIVMYPRADIGRHRHLVHQPKPRVLGC